MNEIAESLNPAPSQQPPTKQLLLTFCQFA